MDAKRRIKLAIKTVGIPLRLRLGTFRHYAPRSPRLPEDLGPRGGERPLVSVVTPSFNQGSFLDATMRSVLEQSYPRVEYVVQDGGSSDRSAEVIRSHETRLASWRSEPDRGHGDALNRGFARTSGELMAWLNSDDLLLPGAIEAAVRVFEDDPGVDVVYGHRVCVDEDGMEVGRWVLPPHRDGAFVWRDYIPQETMFWRRSIWERAGARIDDSLGFAVDWDLVL
ncbi:MAG: glycosyltransferase family 2 protein, partial [Planctomycetota bacterium]